MVRELPSSGTTCRARFMELPPELRWIFAGAYECVDLAAVEDHRSVPLGTDLDVRRVHGPANRDLSTADPGDDAGFPAHRQVPCEALGPAAFTTMSMSRRLPSDRVTVWMLPSPPVPMSRTAVPDRSSAPDATAWPTKRPTRWRRRT
jgi:hypothetical protein